MSLFRHYGLDPESSNDLKMIDSGFRRNDDREAEMGFFKGSSQIYPYLESMIQAPSQPSAGGASFQNLQRSVYIRQISSAGLSSLALSKD